MIIIEFPLEPDLYKCNLIIHERIFEALDYTGDFTSFDIDKCLGKRYTQLPFKGNFIIDAKSRLSITDFIGCHISDLPKNVVIKVEYKPTENDNFTMIFFRHAFYFNLEYSRSIWKENYSIIQLFEQYDDLCKYKKYSIITRKEVAISGDKYVYKLAFLDKFLAEMTKDIIELYKAYNKTILEFMAEAKMKLVDKESDHPFKAQFEFPDHLKHECEQYLSYFGQFLSDVGIESDTEATRRGQEILFSVLPKDKKEAIEKISQAFAIFLSLPALHEGQIGPDSGNLENQIKMQRMEAAITHLKSQLQLAQATMLAQQDHINTLKAVNFNIMADSLVKVITGEKESDGVAFLNDTIKIKPYEGKFFEIDLPKVIEEVKKRTKKLIQ